MSPRRLPRFFSFALLAVLNLHVLALEGCLHAFWNATRVGTCGPQMRHDGHQAKPVEGDKVKQTFAFQGDAYIQMLVIPIQLSNALNTYLEQSALQVSWCRTKS